jgi:hypothetical protein
VARRWTRPSPKVGKGLSMASSGRAPRGLFLEMARSCAVTVGGRVTSEYAERLERVSAAASEKGRHLERERKGGKKEREARALHFGSIP